MVRNGTELLNQSMEWYGFFLNHKGMEQNGTEF
jgi:hypothetical protein